MARPLRIKYTGAWYHVMNRGRRKDLIFFSDSDYKMFMEVLKEAVQMFCLEIHAFALMPNHYHILIRTPLGNISRAMRHINGVYTQKINNKYKKEGSLFRGRYKSILINKEEYFLELVRYIHRNPSKAGLENILGEYEWCSHRMYMKEAIREEWLKDEEVLKSFSKYKKEARRKLEAFIKEEVPKGLFKKLESVKWPTILGDKEFKKKIERYIKGEEIKQTEIPEYEIFRKKDKIEDENLNQFLCNKQEILSAKGSRKLLDKRRAIIFVLKEKTLKSNRALSDIIGNITGARISQIYKIALKDVIKKEGCYKEVKRYLKEI